MGDGAGVELSLWFFGNVDAIAGDEDLQSVERRGCVLWGLSRRTDFAGGCMGVDCWPGTWS